VRAVGTHARRGSARRGRAGLGKAWRGIAGERTAYIEVRVLDAHARLGKARLGWAWLGKASQGEGSSAGERHTPRFESAAPTHGVAWHGGARHGEAKRGEGSRWVNGMHSGSSPEHPRNKQVKGSRAGKHRDPLQPHTPRKKKLHDPPKQYSQLPSSATGGDAPLPSASQRPDR
jgi:hypothetical protein